MKTIAFALAAVAIAPATASAAPVPPNMMGCKMVKPRTAHGGFIMGNSTLSPIKNGRVRTFEPTTMKTVYARFKSNSGKWIVTRDGKRYALADQWISRNGRKNGNLVIAAPNMPGRRVMCTPRMGFRAMAADTASYPSDGSLASSGYTEVNGSTKNVNERPLENYATYDVCGNLAVHPDGAARSPTNPNPSPGIFCYRYKGAGMNDPYGVERYSPAQGGTYIDDPYHRHFISYTGGTVAAAKRPNTYPDGRVILNSAIAWRTVNNRATIAN